MKAALGENPKKTHGARNRSPMTRMATAALLRDALDQACHDKNRRAAAGTPAPAGARPDSPAPDARWQSLLPVLSGDMILKIHVHRSDDILTAVRLAEAYGLRYTLEHCSEGYRVVDELARAYTRGRASEHGCGLAGQGRLEGVIVGPLLSDRSKPELARSDLGNAAVLAAAGIPLAIMTDHPVVPLSFVTLNAAAAVRGGLPEDKALAGITCVAARLCGCADLIGSLEPGKWADLALFSGHPFDYRSHCRLTFIQGRLVYRDEREADWEEV
jgi:imidazolonepropionase-like amidohydrolase